MGIESIGAGIKTRLETISGLRIFAPDELPDTINSFPSVVILPGETVYQSAFDADTSYNFRIILLMTKQDQPSALESMLDYLEPTGAYSIRAAIDGDKTLNSSADTCVVISNSGIGSTVWGGYVYLSSEWLVKVYV